VPGAPVPDWATDARHNAPRWLEDSLKQYEAQGRIGRDPLASFRTSMEELACKIPIDEVRQGARCNKRVCRFLRLYC
jgi:hypothetical protein